MNYGDRNDTTVATPAPARDNLTARKAGLAACTGMTPKKNKPAIENVGEIAYFVAPDGWIEQPQEQSYFAHRGFSHDFCPPGNPNVTLSIYSRGTTISERSAESLQEILHTQLHSLSSSEIESITQVLSKLADQDAFKIHSAQTDFIAGKKVLIVDGHWKISKIQFHGALLASGMNYREIQEIFFEATGQEFSKHFDDATESICSIKWNQADTVA